ncbi:MAG TPA: SDR family oxidoreductase [Dehalococcoidia bacterium]|nr:SDR family oxidoreductase [Dehalococcoidia bacterium]
MSQDLFSLAGRVALVTGGNGGIGRAMALGLRDAGARVAVTGRDAAKNETIAADLGDTSAVFSLDVRDEAAVERVIVDVVERFGRLDILINNAGVTARMPTVELSSEVWHSVVDTHLSGAFYCAKHAARAMIARGQGGKIINIGSMYSIFGPPNVASYAAAKTGLLGLTRALAVEFAAHNIQVNAILPGWYLTGLTDSLLSTPVGQEIRRKTPAGRWGEPEELVGTTIFLASAASNFVTGVAIPVDGGYSVADRFLHQ